MRLVCQLFALSCIAFPKPALAAATQMLSSAAASAALDAQEAFAVTPDGVRIYYRSVGQGSEVVIAPFALYYGRALDSLARGRRVVTYDPRGRGRSDAVPAAKISLDHLLVDLDAVRRAVGADKVSLVGWSGAGMELYVYTIRNSDRVTRLIQLAPVAARFMPYGASMFEDREARTDLAAKQKFEAKLKAGDFAGNPRAECEARNAVTVPPLLADPSRIDRIPNVCIWPNEHEPTLGNYFGALFPSIREYDWRQSLESSEVPRLVIYPLRDNIPRAGVEEWTRGQSNARMLLIRDSGHFPMHEQPNATIEAIDTFLNGQWPADSITIGVKGERG